MGAWIEMIIKLLRVERLAVAPLVGAWIEIFWEKKIFSGINVAPLVGAWIEIDTAAPPLWPLRRRSPCGSVD